MNASDFGGYVARRALVLLVLAGTCAAHAQAEAPPHAPPETPHDVPRVISDDGPHALSRDATPDTASTLRWPEADTVDELLRRETRAALAAQGRRRMMQDPLSGTESKTLSEPQPDRIDLAAIYGIGKRLHVEVLVNGQRLRYRHGRKWPDEAPDGASAYALLAIEGHCVKLDGASGDRRVCLPLAH